MGLLKDRTYILVDTETTGLNEEENQILEIAFLMIKDLKIVDEYEFKIKHNEYSISEKAMEINNISLIEHEKDALEEKEVLEKIIVIIESYKEDKKGLIPIGQNVDFDLKFIKKMFEKNGMGDKFKNYFDYKKLDLMQVALLKCLEGKLELESQSLDSILKALNIEKREERHRALVDCNLEYKALIGLIGLK